MCSLENVAHVEIPQSITPAVFNEGDSVLELHHLCDGSQQAYGACSYIRCINSKGQINSQLNMSKSKVAPLKQCSFPRLELQGTVLAVKINYMLQRALDIRIDQC